MFGHFLHWFPTREEWEALTIDELVAMRELVDEINTAQKGK